MKIIAFFITLLVNTIFGIVIGTAMDVNLFITVPAMYTIASAMSFVPIHGLRVGVYVDVWTGELVKQFTHAETATFLDGITDYSRYVENDIIHLVKIGISPDVLIDNSTYPIPLQVLDDEDIPVSLHKFTTKTTPITDDELYALSYDKIASVRERHGNAIMEGKFDMAIHAFAPASNSAKTPVLACTGADDGTGRAKLTRKDVIRFKKQFDGLKVRGVRRLVLCNDHVSDLLEDDQKFENQYYNYTSGKIANMYGFEVFEYVNCPYFNTAGTKKSFGATPASTDYQASVAFSVKRVFKAYGSTKMYWSAAENDTEYHRNKVNFEHRGIAMPVVNEAIGAIRSVQYTPKS